MANAYEKWVNWRCEKIYATIAGWPAFSRPAHPVKLLLDCWGPNFAEDYTASDWEQKGWLGLIHETGLDPALSPHGVDRPERCAVVSAGHPRQIAGARGPPGNAPSSSILRPSARSPSRSLAAASPPFAWMPNRWKARGWWFRGLGMQRGLLQNKETIHGAGILNGAGRHALMRYANAMADGNITWIADGSHGQPIGQPQFTGEFFAEGCTALPEIPMARLEGSGDATKLFGMAVPMADIAIRGRCRCRLLIHRIAAGSGLPTRAAGRASSPPSTAIPASPSTLRTA